MESINNFLMEYLGEFTPTFIEKKNVGTYMFLDMEYLIKAALLIICTIFFLKFFFRLLDFLIHWR